jgi:dye decolorizing peroxidase
MSTDQQPSRSVLSRRGMLAAGGAAILGAAGGFVLASGKDASVPTTSAPPAPATSPPPTAEPGVPAAPVILPFYGTHQAGVETEPALFQTFVGLDLISPTRKNAEATMRLVTDDAARLTQGQSALADTQPELALNADRLTISVGLGHSLFERIGLADRIPEQFPVIPRFRTDAFEEPWSGTDLLLQVGATDPLTLAHTLRMLTKDLSTLARVRWSQPGFRSNAPASMGVASRRNLMGQVEATHFPAPGSEQFATVVWIDDGPDWVVGGTVLVLRRIRMLLDTWDILDRPVQETVMGRSLSTGQLLGDGADDGVSPFDAVDDNGLPVIPADAHIRVARADSLEGVMMRRPYNYDSGMHKGTNDVGLLFAAYTRDPRTSFIPTQRRLARGDAFQRWISTVGSATYVLPGGVAEGDFLAQGLFA